MEKLELNEENLTQSKDVKIPVPEKEGISSDDPVVAPVPKVELEEETEEKSESDVSPEERELLDTDHIHADLSEDELLRKRIYRVEGGDDLDVPGSELDDADEELGEEDEENNYYSIGGDRHEDLEENPTAPDKEKS